MAELKGRTDAEISVPLIRHMIINALRSYKVKYGKEFGEIVIACDARKYWRKESFSYYKANRKQVRVESGFDWHAIFAALNQVKAELVENFNYPVIEVDGAEADDVIAALVDWTQSNGFVQQGIDYQPQQVLILSGDKDFVQLQKYSNVKQYSSLQKKWLKPETTIAEFLMEHILLGDKGDGIPNFLSADDTFVSGSRQKPITKKNLALWNKTTVEQWDTGNVKNYVRRNAGLIDFTYIPKEVIEGVISSYMKQLPIVQNRGRTKLLGYFVEHKMGQMIERASEF